VIVPIISGVLAAAKPILERFFPDPAKRLQFEIEMRQLDLESLREQIEVNKIEAAHPSVFVSGWRPFIGWVGGVGLAWQFIIAPIVTTGFAMYSPWTPSLPVLDSNGTLMALVTALLGIGAMRSYDKSQGTSK
jgi:hypothetical protein